MNGTKLNRWPKLILGVVTLLFAGIIYAWSILKAPLASEFGWDNAALALNFTLMLCFFCIGGLISGLLSKKTSPKLRMIISAVAVFIGFFAASKLGSNSIALLYIAYGVILGTGIGIVYNTVISVTSAWFPDKKGLCSGAMMMGFGFSTLVLGNIAGSLIDSSFGWRNTYLVLAIVIGLVILLAGLLIKLPGKDIVFPEVKQKKTGNEITSTDYETRAIIKRASFWKLFVFFILLASVGSTMISFAKDFSLSFDVSSSFAVTLVGILSIFNGLGRLASGTIFDMFGLRKTQIVTSAVAIAGPVVALLAVLCNSMVLCVLGLCLCGFSYGFSPTVTAAFASSFYGMKNYALNFSVMNLVLIPASFVSTIAGKMVATSGGYTSVFIMLTIFSLVGLVINLSIKKA